LQRDLQHWIPLLNHFDFYLSKHLTFKTDDMVERVVSAESSANFPKHNVLAILRMSCLILKHCVNKQMYNSLKVCSLFSQTDDTVDHVAML
jgi:hypothetical protein